MVQPDFSQGSVLVIIQVYFTQMVSLILIFFYIFLASEMCGLYWQGRNKELHGENK